MSKYRPIQEDTVTGSEVGLDNVQTLTNKTIDGDDNTLQDIAYSSIKSTSRSGSDATLITGTKGTDGSTGKWNADGDLVDGFAPTGVDANLVSGTAGTTDYTAKWNGDGDLVDGYEVKDEDDMSSDSDTALATQQSIKAYADSAGKTYYDYVVASSGGDYTTLGAAITAASAGDSIFVRSGTYTESAITTSTANLTIVGENPKTTVISMTTNDATFSGAYVSVRDLGWSATTGGINFTGDNFDVSGSVFTSSGAGANTVYLAGTNGGSKFWNNTIVSSGQGDGGASLEIEDSQYLNISDNVILNSSTTATHYGIEISGYLEHSNFTGNLIDMIWSSGNNATCVKGPGGGDSINGLTFTGNLLKGSGGSGSNAENGFDFVTSTSGGAVNFTGNTIFGGDRGIALDSAYNGTITGNQFGSNQGIYLQGGCYGYSIVSNSFNLAGTSDTGVTLVNANNCSVIGNVFRNATTGVSIDGDCEEIAVVGNSFLASTTAISNSGVRTEAYANGGRATPTDVSRHMYVYNDDGDNTAAGDVVVWKADASGRYIQHTTTGGDDLVAGVCQEAINNGASGHILVEGKTTLLKVDGTDDIAIGDWLSTFTSAGIAKKAAAGDTAFAIALEAYTSDDSSGVIDALLVSPRKVGAVV